MHTVHVFLLEEGTENSAAGNNSALDIRVVWKVMEELLAIATG